MDTEYLKIGGLVMNKLTEELIGIVGAEGVISEADELLVYDCDAIPHYKFRPQLVVLPCSTAEVSAVVKLLAKNEIPFAPRGAGTGLSGGALTDGISIALTRMRRLLDFDPSNRRAIVETGYINAYLSREAERYGLFYVPDPSSQSACTIGGNIAENSGGIHCLKYGTTVDHVLAIRAVLPNGEIIDLDERDGGLDLRGLFIGSEGTFGIATEATLRLTPLPESVRTLLTDFTDVNDASRAVSSIIANGILPAALEMMDRSIIHAIEASAYRTGMPLDAEAVLLIELDGMDIDLDDELEQAAALCLKHGARSVKRATSEEERKQLWAARKSAFGAVGRITPDVMIQDAVVPRSRLPEVLAQAYKIGAKYNLRVANVFHAGDGNLHPLICYDSRLAREVENVREAGRELMHVCISVGGSITGEHGVGLDKINYLPLIFSEADMGAMLRVRAAFNPLGLCNPGKIIPIARSCGEAKTAVRNPARHEIRGAAAASFTKDFITMAADDLFTRPAEPTGPDELRYEISQLIGDVNTTSSASTTLSTHPANKEEALEVLKLAIAAGWRVIPAGNSNWLSTKSIEQNHIVFINTQKLSRILDYEPADLVTTVECGLSFSDLSSHLAMSRQWLPLDPPFYDRSTVGGITATGLSGPLEFGFGAPRGYVIGMHVALANGDVIKAGGRVVKNVAGYDLCKLFTGSFGSLGLILDLTFKLRPLPESFQTVCLLDNSIESLFQAADKILASQCRPAALEIISASVRKQLERLDNEGREGREADNCLLARFVGHEKSVKREIEKTVSLVPGSIRYDEDEKVLWSNLTNITSTTSAISANVFNNQVRLLPSRLSSAIIELENRLGAGASWHASIGTGRLRIIDPDAFFEPTALSDAVIRINTEIKKQLDLANLFPDLRFDQ